MLSACFFISFFSACPTGLLVHCFTQCVSLNDNKQIHSTLPVKMQSRIERESRDRLAVSQAIVASSLSLKPFLVSTVVSCLSCRVMCRGMHTSVAVDRHWPPKDRRPLSPKRRPTAGKSNWITQTVHYAAVTVGLEGFVCLFTFATGQCLCGAPLSFSFPLT